MVSKRVRDAALVPIGIGMIFFAYAFTLWGTSPRWNSPDETANAFFTRLFAEKGGLSVFEPLNFVVGDTIHPRSVTVVNGYLVPGGFFGMILIYGTIARILGAWIIPYLTPAVAVAGIFAFAALVRPAVGRGAAVLAGALLAFHPAYWYYSARGLFPNVPFLAFAIVGAYFLCRQPFSRFLEGRMPSRLSRTLDDMLGALFLVFALWTRPSELLWLAPSAALLAVAFRQQFPPARLIRIVGVGVLGAAFLLALNQSLYGSPFATGYNAPPDDYEIAFHAGLYPNSSGATSNPLLPFGAHPRRIVKNVWDYGLRFFWWYTIPAALGIALALQDWRRGLLRREGKAAFVVLMCAAAVLGVVYGSGAFSDTLNPRTLSIGDSHARYFLPAYVLAIPFAAFGILRLVSRVQHKALRRGALSAVFVGIALASGARVYWSAGEGLLAVRQTLARYERVAAKVFELVPESGVIITDRNDKVFFPERRVVVPLRDPGTFKALPILARRAPLFYYGITLADREFRSLNEGVFGENGLKLTLVEPFDSEALYKVERK